MHSSGSFLYTVIEKIRIAIDEPATSAKWTDDLLTRLVIADAWASTFSMLKLTSDSLPVISFTIDLVRNQSRYVIPPLFDSVVRLVRKDTNNADIITHDWKPRGDTHPWMSGWRLEGNEIVFEPTPTEADAGWTLMGVPSGDACLHYGIGAVVDPTHVTLAASPVLGLLDRRPNGYAGLVLRTLSTGRTWQERVISSYDPVTRIATFASAFVQDANNLPANAAAVTYEIAPLGNRMLWTAVAYKAAMAVGASRDLTEKKMKWLELQYQIALKAVFDRAKAQRRVIQHYDRATVDNKDLGRFDVWCFSD